VTAPDGVFCMLYTVSLLYGAKKQRPAEVVVGAIFLPPNRSQKSCTN